MKLEKERTGHGPGERAQNQKKVYQGTAMSSRERIRENKAKNIKRRKGKQEAKIQAKAKNKDMLMKP